jgi:hypothetical protein
MFKAGVEHFLDPDRQSPHFAETAVDCVKAAVQFSQLIAESADEKTFWKGTEQRRHRSPAGNMTGVTREKKRFWTGTPYRETTRTDGTIKSTSEERSTGGTSKHDAPNQNKNDSDRSLRVPPSSGKIAVALPTSGEIL